MKTSKTRGGKCMQVAGFALAILMGSSLCFSAWAQEVPAEIALTSSVSQAAENTAESEQEKQQVALVENATLEAGNFANTEEPVPSEVSPEKARRPGNKELENTPESQPESLVQPEFYVLQEAQVLDLAAPEDSAGNWVVDTAAGTITVSGTGPYRVQGSTTNYSLVVNANTTLTLSNVTVTQASVAPVQVQSGCTLSLVLEGDNTVSTTSDTASGIYVPAGAAVQISGEGSLTVTGAAGIGAAVGKTGAITIAGGTVNAVGTAYLGSGIGGENTTISITGGTVVAKGGSSAAGIGGEGETNIVITDGNITSQSGPLGAGIGNNKGKTKIEISGGVIHATSVGSEKVMSLNGRPGIGGAEGSVTITGGTVEAVGSMGAAGIGGGARGILITVEISGGTVKAAGGIDFKYPNGERYGAGIGCGYSGSAVIRITGGEVTAHGSVSSSGIGNAADGSAIVSITGGKVVAYGNSAAVGSMVMTGSAGISASELTIAGVAEVTSYGGAGVRSGGPGITAANVREKKYNKLILDGTAHIVAVGARGGNGIYMGYNQSIENTYPGEGRQIFQLGKDIKLEAYAENVPAIRTLMETTGDGYVQNNFYNPATLKDVTGFIATAGGANIRTTLQQKTITLPAGYYAFAVMSSAKGLVYDINEEIPRPVRASDESGISTAEIPGRQGNIDAYELVMAPYDTVQFFAGEAVGVAANMPHMQYVRKSNTGSYLLPQVAPTFPHYTFLGWLPNDGTGTLYPAASAYKPLSSDVMFTAQWALNQYSVVFDGNGATAGSMENQTAGYGAQINLNKNSFTRTGYDFVGWNTDKNALSGLYGDEGDYTQTEDADVTLYAIWLAKGYGVSFNANNGSGEMAPLTIQYGETKLLPKNTFTRIGYDFVGWNTDVNALSGIYADESSYTQTGENDVTLYAIWVAKGYGVSFNANNGSGEMAPLAIQYGETKLLPKNTFTRTGYNFMGWNTDETAPSALYEDEANYTQTEENDVILYAVWKVKRYRLAFDVQGGSPAPEVQMVAYGTKAAMPVPPTKAGHNFVGWYNEAESGSRWDFEKDTMPAKDMALYAHWEKISASSAPSSIVNSESSSSSPVADGGVVSSSSTKKSAIKPAMQPATSKPVSSSVVVSDSASKIGPESVAAEKTTSDEVPLVGISNEKTWGLVNLLAAVAVALCSVFLLISSLRRRKRGESGSNDFSRTLLCALAIVLGVVSAILFLTLNNLGGTMRLVTQWTPLWCAILAIQSVLVVMWARHGDGE